MKRNFFDYLILVIKGMAMGAADVVPGVSGGTIAFISGIYEELISALNNINLGTIKSLKSEGVAATWNKINGNFLTALFTRHPFEYPYAIKISSLFIRRTTHTALGLFFRFSIG